MNWKVFGHIIVNMMWA